MRIKEDRLLINMRNRKDELEKSEKIKMQKALERSGRISNDQVSWIRNSLRAYSQREDSKKIRDIVRTHRNVTQFINRIEDVPNINSLETVYNPQYSTVSLECT